MITQFHPKTRRHPERSRFSGVAKDLSARLWTREILLPAGDKAALWMTRAAEANPKPQRPSIYRRTCFAVDSNFPQSAD